MGKIGLAVIGVVEHGDKHGGNPVEASDLFLIDAGQRGLRREIGDRREGGAVGHGGGHRQHHTKAVEHRHLDHHAVRRGETHAVADGFAVVDDIVMGEHNPFGETGGSGGILHIADIVSLDGGGAAVHFFRGNHVGPFHDLIKGETAGLFEADGNDIAEEGQLFAVEGFAGNGVLEFRAEFVDDLGVIGIQCRFDHHQRVGIGLLEQIFRFVDLVSGVHRNEDGADLGGGPESDVPGRNVRRPDGHFTAGGHAHGKEGPGEVIHIVAKFAVSPGVIQGGVAEGVLIGKFLHHAVENLREGFVDELGLGPHVFAATVVIGIERMFFAVLFVEPIHIGNEVSENHFGIVNFREPFFLPFHGNIAVVVDGSDGVHDLLNGQGAFADDLEVPPVIGVSQMHMVDISAEVGDGVRGGFPFFPVGMMDAPERRQLIAGEVVHQIPELACVGENIAGLDEDLHIPFLGFGEELFQHGDAAVHIVLAGADGNIGYAEVLRRFQQGEDGFAFLFAGRGNVAGAVETGNGQFLVVEGAGGSGGVVFMEYTAFAGEFLIFLDIVGFNALESEFFGDGHHIVPCEFGPSPDGKGEFHR